ncbi:MAG: CO dehydrogenase/CO-methylating acetyl-CoA synthase complex subunit beta [Desulfobacula sp.]|jgi:acetyl-CoA synthase|uniref:acetyl-CoA decarbonylase/synthase complex subunit alpha/beta n=1 Tax=Desulfobacula sp. TaxID=2593537 RepID=UPI001D41E3A8|nr:CO dehydrogenase/CO-methylating acetyl-CoA synthase complex subunit beta [Desulfobacula sp.]MBT3486696.1 CO dehydrogenase/CO-methylating acetyl-CoA synthase complex subunit beta [Desulfobacula sp.]MBT3802973.1 CO dehydrogenase/CO-methylating acetyl-CoA synthase complex subunit beta [Desulfobacula sp.]MBT4023514.1 CO dehydrogenase/CO-methylating acetyl-CoA synthase complex subunit beta [Desulfobacula sp.]MBT4197021.1 CO dehydrogenase/CO-methylating acetyl-CoA synthase complex subunit beta [De
MSKLIAFAAIQGGYKVVAQAEGQLNKALQTYDAATKVGFPNTAYYLPVIYSITGIKVETLEDLKKPLDFAKGLLPPHIRLKNWLPYLGPLLDAGMAGIISYEIIEALRYLNEPDFYIAQEDPDIENGKMWVGAADDTILRKRGVEFVDGSAPGFAAMVGAAPNAEIAKMIVEDYQKKSLYIFCAANHNGNTVIQQCLDAGMQVGWNTRIVPFGPDISSAVFALGFANRAAMAFGGVQPGDFKTILKYNKDRVFAFVNALGDVGTEWGVAAAGCVNWGFPTIADTPIPEILPTGICTYEHVVAPVAHEDMVARSIEVRGLKVTVSEIDIPCSFGPAFEGERVRGADLYAQCGGGKTQCTEHVKKAEMNEIEDGKVIIEGPDLDGIKEGGTFALGIKVQIAGREFQEDFEPIMERQIHHLINYIQGVMHIGQRDISWVRISKAAIEKGFTLKDIGVVLHAKFHQDFQKIVDKVQVTLLTKTEDVDKMTAIARADYKVRDARVDTMTDEDVETYYSCTLCQSFAPSHVCTVSPERTGLCGAYNWMDCKASFEINPTGPNQPIEKGEVLDANLGQFKGVNEFIYKASRGTVTHYNFYSMVVDPMTTCGCCECIAAMLPGCNGVMTVGRDYSGDTPCGMKFTTLAGVMGGGASSPGFVGHSKFNITQGKFILGDGGLLRMVWMPKMLKEELKDRIIARGEAMGVPGLFDMIADETVGITEEDILPFLKEKGHPALNMESLVG